jgi:hypothetical protein
MKEVALKAVCQMCGARNGDFWETRPARRVVLSDRPRAGDILQTWTICNECHDGLLGLKLSSRKYRARYWKRGIASSIRLESRVGASRA